MLNVLLNRYYIANANRSIAHAEIQAKVHDLLSKANIGQAQASASGTSLRGKNSHDSRQRELQGLWTNQLIKNREHKHCTGNFCENK